MRSSWAPSTAVLRKYARTHVWYEIDSLLGQLERLESLFPNGDLGNDYVGRALAEACLLHLRVLNDFLAGERHSNQRAKRGHPDVFAAHWLEAWKTRPFLTSAQERRLSRQLAHLSGKRYWPYPWDMHKMTVSGCRALARFLEELDRAHPTRARWFADSRRLVDNFLALETREGSRR